VPRLGLDEETFARLAEEVDQIVHPGALVNHVLSYRSLFEPNVVGTAELIRLALTGRIKRFEYVSTFGVPQMHAGLQQAAETTDVRDGAPEMPLIEGYAQGYGASKWASEVLLREANEHFGLPVRVYRPDMILAHSRYLGQINVPDMFTRLLFSLIAAGIAPGSFYERAAGAKRPKAHYDGLPVEFLAAAMQQMGAVPFTDFRTFNTTSTHLDDGISLDTIADWVASAGYSITRIENYGDWVRRFEEKLRNLSEEQRQHSSLALMSFFARPHSPLPAQVRNEDFVTTVRVLAAGPEVPGLSEAYIHKYLGDMQLLGLLPKRKEAA
jgi:fatty acid CoA ligase FadD9